MTWPDTCCRAISGLWPAMILLHGSISDKWEIWPDNWCPARPIWSATGYHYPWRWQNQSIKSNQTKPEMSDLAKYMIDCSIWSMTGERIHTDEWLSDKWVIGAKHMLPCESGLWLAMMLLDACLLPICSASGIAGHLIPVLSGKSPEIILLDAYLWCLISESSTIHLLICFLFGVWPEIILLEAWRSAKWVIRPDLMNAWSR